MNFKVTFSIFLFISFFSPSPLLADTAEKVRQIMSHSKNWTPKDFNEGMRQIKNLGTEAVPELIQLLSKESESNPIYFLCEALAKVPDMKSLPALNLKFSHKDWLVRSSCGSAYGKIAVTLKSENPNLEPLWLLMTQDPYKQCIVADNVASSISEYNDPKFYNYFFTHLFSGTYCERKTATSGLSKAPTNDTQVGEAFIKIMINESEIKELRENAAWALTEFIYPPARPHLVSLLEKNVNFGNFKSFVIEALGNVGLNEDIKLLEKVIASDPYNGIGVWAVYGREAIQKIRKRSKIR